MAISSFIPSVWAARALVNLEKNLVYAQMGVINRDYEGDIREAGDNVRINMIGQVTINTYTKNTTITWESLGLTDESLSRNTFPSEFRIRVGANETITVIAHIRLKANAAAKKQIGDLKLKAERLDLSQ